MIGSFSQRISPLNSPFKRGNYCSSWARRETIIFRPAISLQKDLGLRIVKCRRCLKQKLQRKLQQPWRPGLQYSTEVGRPNVIFRQEEIRVIGHIETFETKLNLLGLLNPEILEQR